MHGGKTPMKLSTTSSSPTEKEELARVPLSSAVLPTPSHLGKGLPSPPVPSTTTTSSSPCTTTTTRKELDAFLKANPHKVIIVVDGGLYDVTHFMDDHPGGASILKKYRGTECGTAFHRIHGKRGLEKAKPYFIGTLEVPEKK